MQTSGVVPPPRANALATRFFGKQRKPTSCLPTSTLIHFVVHKTGSEVTFKNKAGVELKTLHLWRSTMSTTMYPMATETKWYGQILQYRRMSQGQAKVQRLQTHHCQVKFQGRMKYLNTLEYKLGISKRKASWAERSVWRSTQTVRLPVRYKVIQYKHFEVDVLNFFIFFFIVCLA